MTISGMHHRLFESQYSRTSLNRTLLFQKVVRFSKISVYTRCRIAPANRTKFRLGRGFSDILNRSSKPSKVRISGTAVERCKIYVHTLWQWMKALCLFLIPRDGQNHHMLMILKSKSNHLNKGDLKSKSKSFWKWWFLEVVIYFAY